MLGTKQKGRKMKERSERGTHVQNSYAKTKVSRNNCAWNIKERNETAGEQYIIKGTVEQGTNVRN